MFNMIHNLDFIEYIMGNNNILGMKLIVLLSALGKITGKQSGRKLKWRRLASN